MGIGTADLIFKEPPEDWDVEQYDHYIDRLIKLYTPISLYMNLGDAKEKFRMAEALFEKAWLFIESRIDKFGQEGVRYLHD
jgi:hypothetical protein